MKIMNKDYYSILGISQKASQEEVKRAYRKLAHQYHPDKDGGDEAKFKEINEAYQVLGNSKNRAQYDQFGTTFGQESGGFDFSGQGGPASGWPGGFGFDINLDDIFGDIFSRGATRTRKNRGRDIGIDLEITLEEAFRGTVRELELRKFTKCQHCQGSGAEPGSEKIKCDKCNGSGEIRQTKRTILGLFSQVRICPICNGEGEYPEKACKECGGDGRVRAVGKLSVPIPAGIDTGGIIKINASGEEGPRGGTAGDLIIQVRIKEHPYLKRQGENLYSDIEISFPQAVFGDNVEVNTIDGQVDLKITPGIQSGTQLRLAAKGMPIISNRRGDHLVTVRVKTPKKLSRKGKKLLEELKNELE